MIEQEIPGVYVLSVMIGKNIVEVTSRCKDIYESEIIFCEENGLCISHMVMLEQFKEFSGINLYSWVLRLHCLKYSLFLPRCISLK